MKRLRAIADYLRLLWPPAFKRLCKRLDDAGFSRGYIHGLGVGHRRGWMQLRSKVTKSPNKYPHESEAVNGKVSA